MEQAIWLEMVQVMLLNQLMEPNPKMEHNLLLKVNNQELHLQEMMAFNQLLKDNNWIQLQLQVPLASAQHIIQIKWDKLPGVQQIKVNLLKEIKLIAQMQIAYQEQWLYLSPLLIRLKIRP
jgi:hypothetical protein